MSSRASLLVALALLLAPTLATPAPLAPNLVEITPLLVTSGQPSARSLATLGAQGFEAVIYLAPPTVSDAVLDEAQLLERQGIAYINIPVKFGNPTEKDYDAFVAALKSLSKRKVLVHCQVNLRASTFVFLYRVLELKESPAAAYESVVRIWTPHGPWKPLVQKLLGRNGIKFDMY